jgi:hypothetical protein
VAIVCIELALKELPDKCKAVAVLAQADEIGEQYLLEARGQTRREVAHLIGMRENDIAWLEFSDELFERRYVTVTRVILQQRMLDPIALVELLAGKLGAHCFQVVADDGRREGLTGCGCDLLSGSKRLP